MSGGADVRLNPSADSLRFVTVAWELDRCLTGARSGFECHDTVDDCRPVAPRFLGKPQV